MHIVFTYEASVNCLIWHMSNYNLNVSFEAFTKRFMGILTPITLCGELYPEYSLTVYNPWQQMRGITSLMGFYWPLGAEVDRGPWGSASKKCVDVCSCTPRSGNVKLCAWKEELNIWCLKICWPRRLINSRGMWRAKGRSWKIWRTVHRGNFSHTALIPLLYVTLDKIVC